MGVAWGGNVGVYDVSNLTEIGLALDGEEWTTNWSNGPLLYVNNTPEDTYEGVFGFQNKTNYTDGRITLLKNTDISGSLNVTNTGSFNIAYFQGNNEYYGQVNIKNTNSGSNSSTDLVLTANNGTETNHYVDLGINSSTYGGGLVGGENDAYLLNVGKDLYIGTIGGSEHPAKLFLFAENNWENPQVTVHTGSQITFNTPSFTEGYMYEFSGSVKLQNDLNVSGSVTASYFVGDGSQLTNLPLNTNWNNGKEYVVRNTEQLTFSGDYILEDSNLLIEGGETEIEYSSNKYFFKVGSIFIGGNLLVKDSHIQNNGKISVGGEVILIGNYQITVNVIII
jgi:hypothetical protein